MDRFRDLDRYPKILLIALVTLAVVFAGVYGYCSADRWYSYKDVYLTCRQTEDATIYSGRANGGPCVITVRDDTVTFRTAMKTYGPYALREDPTALPDDMEPGYNTIGIEITENGAPFFRGALVYARAPMFYQEDGTLISPIKMYGETSDGTVVGPNGVVADPYEPTLYNIVECLYPMEHLLESRAQWSAYLMGLLVCAIGAVDILFADELFRFRLSFRLRDADRAEPSDWELASRKIGWTILFITALYAFLLGLQ